MGKIAIVNTRNVEIVRVARGELLRAVFARVDVGAGEVARLHVGLEVALGAAHFQADAAPKTARPQRFDVGVKSVQVAAYNNNKNGYGFLAPSSVTKRKTQPHVNSVVFCIIPVQITLDK